MDTRTSVCIILYACVWTFFKCTSGSSSRTVVFGNDVEHVCMPLEIKYCEDVLLYNETFFPNLLFNPTQDDARTALLEFTPLINMNCSDSLKQFLCLIYAPPCTDTRGPVPVCKSLCEMAVTKDCRTFTTQINVHPIVFDCSRYPSSGLCITPEQVSSGKDGEGGYDVTPLNPFVKGPDSYFSESGSAETIDPTLQLDLFLLVTSGAEIQLLNIKGPDQMDTIPIYLRADSENNPAIDLYLPNKYVYWASTVDTKTNYVDATLQLDLFLLVTSGAEIQLLNIKGPDQMDTIPIYLRADSENNPAIDLYLPNKYVYWASTVDAKICRGTLKNDQMYNIRNLVDTGSSIVTSIVVDWNLKVLFWSEIFVNPEPLIRTSSLSGRGVTTVIQDNLVHPVSLTLDPAEGKIFWVDKKGSLREPHATIESYSIVTQRRTLIRNISSSTFRGAGRPTAMVADVEEKKLYWIDSRSKSLHSMNYDGSDHRTILQDSERLNDPESIIIKGDYLYWMDRNSLMRVNKKNGSDELLIKVFERNPPQRIRLYEEKKKIKSNYDRSALAKTWRDLSSSESMEDKPYYDADEDYYDDVEKPKSNRKSSSQHISIDLALIITIALSVFVIRH